jgi:cellulose synthase/poly-beta-1,6-N-acetylglucosamine synthase-like glycosyltransferase
MEDEMKDILYNFTSFFQICVFILILYYLIISLFGLIKVDKVLCYKPEKSFAFIIAAHNEEKVIKKIIESLKAIDYPKNLYDIFVVADNCSDRTAAICRNENVNVYERYDKKKRGKGYAIQWMLEKLFKLPRNYDAICILDADNLVSRNFLQEMNCKMLDGHEVVQGYIDSKNPFDSWITQSYSISFWSSNRLFQLSRSNLNLCNQIGGTGFIVSTEILKKIGWSATCLTEDLEFTCKLVLNNYKVAWAHKAIVYDEKPLSLKQSWRQRKRWMQGFTDVASRYFFKLLKKSIKENNFMALDCALYTIQPFVTLLVGFSFLMTLLQNNSASGLHIFTIETLFPLFIWRLFSVFQFMLTPIVLLLEKKIQKSFFALLCLYPLNVFLFEYMFDPHESLIKITLAHFLYIILFTFLTFYVVGKKGATIFVWYLLYSLYTLTWIPITIQGIINKNSKEWAHTEHVRQIGISEI